MKKEITVNIVFDSERWLVLALDTIVNGLNRCEWVSEGIDKPISVDEASMCIRNAIGDEGDLTD